MVKYHQIIDYGDEDDDVVDMKFHLVGQVDLRGSVLGICTP